MNNLFSVESKTVVVTGGSRGIGLMIARGFVEGGARVYVSSRKAEVCERVAAELSRVGECVAVPADLSGEAACRRLAERGQQAPDRLGGPLGPGRHRHPVPTGQPGPQPQGRRHALVAQHVAVVVGVPPQFHRPRHRPSRYSSISPALVGKNPQASM